MSAHCIQRIDSPLGCSSDISTEEEIDAVLDGLGGDNSKEQFHQPYLLSSNKCKRSLCKNFTEQMYCPYGDKCQFAHGPA